MKRIFLCMAMTAMLVACTKEELNPDAKLLGMGGDTWERTELDDWLYHEFVVPYNMEIKYKWDPYELDLGKNYVPVDESRVKELMIAVKKVWIEPYESQAGSNFIKKLAPKRYVLVGSLQYNATTTTLGFAEGGNKIVILDVNSFNPKDPSIVRKILHTAEHEFVHTLHQTTLYPSEWQTICRESYTGSWQSTPDAEFGPAGFVSKYARANPDEDFAETISHIVVNGRQWFEDYMTSVGTDAAAKLRAKENIIIAYFKTIWNIDFYETYDGAGDGLVEMTQEAIARL
ncbi:MAG: putative zinc-binding metallopeptidase [Prevotellaceae bacterium]|nr:putative zinc-binding metallopeptidase [Prevotellaceae bacterium]